jgi:hypothetical protein
VSAEIKSAQKIKPDIGTEGSKRRHFLTKKMVVTKKIRIFLAKTNVQPGAHWRWRWRWGQ